MKSEFTIEQGSRDSFGNYHYKIFRDVKLVASYGHDFRGDEQGITIDGRQFDPPFGRMSEFLEGGAGKPLELTAAGVEFLRQKVPA